MPDKIHIKVSEIDDGQRLDVLLTSAAAIGSRAAAQKLINGGLVLVDGRARSKNFRVSTGQTVAAQAPQREEQGLEPEAMALSIPYEDDYLLVVDKPAGLVTHPSRGHASGTLVNGLLAHGIAGGDEFRPGIVHRLDKDTSGLLIVARDEDAHRKLSAMLRDHEVERVYLALVHGLFETREGTVEAPLGRDSSHRQQMAVTGRQGRDAVTHFRVIQSWAPPGVGPGAARDGFSLLEVKLETGRTHQIRVHLAAIGHPVAGDSTYGQRRDTLGIGRQFLHSARLEFLHPVTGEPVRVQSELPADLQAALDSLRGQAPGV
ncbi:MAG: RluA family pseudouridine synthase [Thermoleophilia bacterium]